MTPTSGTRVLFVDDSGKPSPRHTSGAVVIGGFSIPSEAVGTLSRRIAGAKARFWAKRGDPITWEIKASMLIKPNAWNRAVSQNFIAEIARILEGLDCTAYAVSIDKRKLHHQMSLTATMPLQMRALAEHFAVECREQVRTGILVSDWSNHQLDAHASKRVASYIVAKRLPLHPGIYYANSLSSHAIQVADLIAGIRRRTIEGDAYLGEADGRLESIQAIELIEAQVTHTGRTFANWNELI